MIGSPRQLRLAGAVLSLAAPTLRPMVRFDSNGYPQREEVPTQRVLNEAWPYERPEGRKMVPTADPKCGPIITGERRRALVRVEWEHDGTEHIEATVTRRTPNGSHVFAEWNEPRLPIFGLWVRGEDATPI